jgi:hypothetical protein
MAPSTKILTLAQSHSLFDRSFASAAEFEEAFGELLSKHFLEFAAGYSYDRALDDLFYFTSLQRSDDGYKLAPVAESMLSNA